MFENNMENIEVIGVEEDIKRKVFPKIFTGSFKVNIKDLNFSSPIWKICKKTNGYKIDKYNTFFVFDLDIIAEINKKQEEKWSRREN